MVVYNVVLKGALVRAGLTQRGLAMRTEIAENHMSEIVTGYRQPTPDQAKRIARVLKVAVRVLFPSDVEQAAS